MPQVVRRASYGSVTVFWLNRKAALEAVRVAAGKLIGADPNVTKVVLFGSLARGTATAGSDADILIVLRDSDEPILGRTRHFADTFRDVGLPVELFVYTENEIAGDTSSIAENALKTGIELQSN
jgi:predicted nucleotidyltransferase